MRNNRNNNDFGLITDNYSKSYKKQKQRQHNKQTQYKSKDNRT